MVLGHFFHSDPILKGFERDEMEPKWPDLPDLTLGAIPGYLSPSLAKRTL
jgi:hypothetical protein